MNKVIAINLNGNAYQVEESGYDALCDYLDSAEAKLKDNPDRVEIIADLEQAIAEKCQRFLLPQKSVITSVEIDQIIKEMGPVYGADSDAGEAGSAGDSGKERKAQNSEAGGAGAQAQSGPAPHRRLFRIYEGRRISGVCKGLGAYFGIDENIVRVVFLALAFFTNAAMVPVYILLVVVIPYAQTSEDYAAAYGMPFNAQDFVNEVKNESEDWKKRAKQHTREWKRSWRRGIRNPRRWWQDNYPSYSEHPYMGLLIPIVVFLFFIPLIVGMFRPIGLRGMMFGWWLPLGLPAWLGIVLTIWILRMLFMPLRFAFGRSRYVYRGSYYAPIGVLGSLCSTLVMIFFIWWAYNNVSQVHFFLQNVMDWWRDNVMNR